MGISLGIVGLGQFGSCFAELYKNHPLVDRIALCDREPERIRQFADREDWKDKFNERDAYASLDDICKSDLDALVIITQPWLHAPQCIQAMESGKHVYSAVPVIRLPDGDETLDWCDKVINACKSTGMNYMLGETTFYHPQTMFCRRKAAEGAFGEFVYAEGEYMHDLDNFGCSLREVYSERLSSTSGKEWVERKGGYSEKGFKTAPMFYPTHSVSGPVSVMNSHAKKVVGYGFKNRNNDPFFEDYSFSNEMAMFEMDNGSTVRICEFRECAEAFHDGEAFRIMGTSGSFAEDVWRYNARTEPGTAKEIVTEEPTAQAMRDPLPAEVADAFKLICNPDAEPESDFEPTGHGGSHPYLVNEFVESVARHRMPAINAWEAAHYVAMGVTANKSALRDGERLTVPDWGTPS